MNPELIDRVARARQSGRLDCARTLLLVALEEEDRMSQGELGDALDLLAQVEGDAGRLDIALRYAQESASLAEQESAKPVLAVRLARIGDLHRAAGRPARAEPYYEEALLILASQPNLPPLHFGKTLRSVATLWDQLGHAEQARMLLNAAGPAGRKPDSAVAGRPV